MAELDPPAPRPRGWEEIDSATFRDVASVAVPDREHQLATLLCLLPFERDQSFTAVDLGCGEGSLSVALLRCFPAASVVAVDGSPSMRTRAGESLAAFGGRGEVKPFDLRAGDWPVPVETTDCVLSSLVLHHLDGPAKRRFFEAARRRITPQGTLLIADLIEPRRPEARSLFAQTWDRAARARSRALFGDDRAFDEFAAAQWNWFRWPDRSDTPSPLADQLEWLNTSGFESVDCFWMHAGHAIFGGYGPEAAEPEMPLEYEQALGAARAALG
jgi:SAM-dependent methyltransferase